ncbi:MAG: DUF1998 domain-containing protein [Bryobacterales bacterium]|nr:DUF1998 domain-containing protein [Bryobacterales bacterium]
MPRDKEKRPHGEIRQGQVVTTFGPGSMTDLPRHSVLIGGLDYWSTGREEVREPRLARKIARILDVPNISLQTPPPQDDDPLAPRTGIGAFQFPEWFVTQDVEPAQEGAATRSRLLVHRVQLTRGKFRDRDKRNRPVVPIRFVRACPNGHIGDIDWYVFVHQGQSDCKDLKRQLYLDERGTSGDLTEVWIRCECGQERSVAQAARLQNRALGFCDGARPWLGPAMGESCNEPNRLLVRTASNAYFPQTLSVISLPERRETIQQAVSAAWDFLEAAESAEDVARERRKSKVREALEGVTDEEVWTEIETRRGVLSADEGSVKSVELETLTQASEEIGQDRPEGLFYARALPASTWSGKPWMESVERVVLVHRLREVVSLVGFTRFESISPDTEGELDINVRRAALARDVSWVPAVENKGEGFFIQFKSSAIDEWARRPSVANRSVALMTGFRAWQREHQGSRRDFPGPRYVLLHTLSHMLLTAVSLRCGYPASSIRERVYAIPEIGYGILLYTGSSDAEGTLGGLVDAGRNIHEALRDALENTQLCSNDPVCAQHEPGNPHERRYLHGAACHGCLLIAETSCEQQNDFLDRALVVRTVTEEGAEFFGEGSLG